MRIHIKNINTSQVIRSIYLLIVILSLTALAAHAQGPIDPGPDPDSAPIDGGLSLLVAGGVGYGVRKIREKRKKQQAEQIQK